jgi:hypothetical protein
MGLALALALLVAAETGVAEKAAGKTGFFPIPMYTTVPTEGSTYGFMPVFLGVAPSEQVRWILAPSVSWNRGAGVNATFRYYRFPSLETSWYVIGAASTKINRTLSFHFDRFPFGVGRLSVELVAQARRNIFFRFFGLGPESSASAESSYTRTTALAETRVGVNLPRHLNAGVRAILRRDWLIQHAVFNLPELQEAHPDAPGLGGAAMGSLGLSLRYDTREGGDYAVRGTALELAGGRTQGFKGFDHFWHVSAQGRALVPETSFLTLGTRLSLTRQLRGHDLPFYYQSTLGGENVLRGYPDDRFIDRGAWEAEVEQRLRVLETHIFHVTTEWRIDPFAAVGQVFDEPGQAFSHPRWAVGAGFRAFVRPNVLGRVDLAYASEGLRIYVVLGYPY